MPTSITADRWYCGNCEITTDARTCPDCGQHLTEPGCRFTSDPYTGPVVGNPDPPGEHCQRLAETDAGTCYFHRPCPGPADDSGRCRNVVGSNGLMYRLCDVHTDQLAAHAQAGAVRTALRWELDVVLRDVTRVRETVRQLTQNSDDRAMPALDIYVAIMQAFVSVNGALNLAPEPDPAPGWANRP